MNQLKFTVLTFDFYVNWFPSKKEKNESAKQNRFVCVFAGYVSFTEQFYLGLIPVEWHWRNQTKRWNTAETVHYYRWHG